MLRFKYADYLLTGTITGLLLAILALVNRFIPFAIEDGRSLLTIDLSQQYLDFFALFRQALLHDPSQILYSFHKGLGGEMLGLWAYYLISPFNLILLIFPKNHLDLAISFLTAAKILASSISFYFLANSLSPKTRYNNLALAQCYALMSYTIAFSLNIMWFDGLVLLPLIVYGLEKLIRQQSPRFYVFSLSLCLICHYYIGYMICIFLAFYALYAIICQESSINFKNILKRYTHFVKYSLIATLTAGIVLFPAFISMLSSKAAQMTGDNQLVWEIVQEHSFLDIASKFFIGAFNYDQMATGSPNIYIGMFAFILAFSYFMTKETPLKDKLAAISILLMYYASFSIELFDKLWHMGQFPIWYNFRFSFTFCFFLLVLALKSARKIEGSLSKKQALILLVAFFILGIQYKGSDYAYLSFGKIALTGLFWILTLWLLASKWLLKKHRQILLLALCLAELTSNAFLIISDNDTYLLADRYQDYTQLLDEAIDPIRPKGDQFYRISQNFFRTKNEAFFGNYFGLNHFSSTLEKHMTTLYQYLGLTSGMNTMTYSPGTLFTDDLFNVRYLLDVTSNTEMSTPDKGYTLYPKTKDLDIFSYPLIETKNRYRIYENTERLGFGIEVSPKIIQSQFNNYQPIQNQEKLLQLIAYDGDHQPFFEPIELDSTQYDNVEVLDRGDGDFYTYAKKDNNRPGSILIRFSTTSSDPYYFTLPSQYSPSQVELRLNGQDYDYHLTSDGRQIINASYNKTKNQQTFRINLKKGQLKANLMALYRFNLKKYQAMIHEKQSHLFQIKHFSSTKIQGDISIQQNQAYLLFPMAYDPAWSIKVDDQLVKQEKVLNDTMMAIPITHGDHKVTLSYRPKSIFYGFIISALGLLLFLAAYKSDQGTLIKNQS